MRYSCGSESAVHAHGFQRFGKSYHVQQQLESVALRGRPISSVAALVEAMFMAELESGLLTAGHDLAAIRPPVTLSVTTGAERYVRLNGQEQGLKFRWPEWRSA